MAIYRSSSSNETKKLGREFGLKVAKSKLKNRALVIALEGDLGTGKTTFVQGLLKGLGVRTRALSPTFIIFRRFRLKRSHFASFYHIDCYRLKGPTELLTLGLREIISHPRNIVVVEWARKIQRILRPTLSLSFYHGPGSSERVIRVKYLK